MKNIILIIFALVIGVAEAWGQGTQTFTAGRWQSPAGVTGSTKSKPIAVQENAIVLYRVNPDVTVNISATSGGDNINASGRTGARPAIILPESSTLVITGDGTINLTGGNGADGVVGKISGWGDDGGDGGGGAAPGIGGIGGLAGKGSDDTNEQYGRLGSGMGKLYVLGNVTVNVTKGTAGASKVGTTVVGGGDGGHAPDYAIGAGGRGGNSKDGEHNASSSPYYGQTSDNGFIFKQSSATITYNNGGSRTDVVSTLALNHLASVGYTFTGYRVGETWVIDESGVYVDGGNLFDKNITVLNERWTKTITLDRQGSTVGSTSVNVVYDCSLPTATAPWKEGYTFMGYFTEPNGGGKQYYNPDMSSTGVWNEETNINTLYAYWYSGGCDTYKTLRINYDSNGGFGTMEPQLIRICDNIKDNKFIKRNASQKQLEFLGWNTQAGGGGTSYQPEDLIDATEEYSEITLYAQWGSPNNTYVISTAQELLDFATWVNGGSTSIKAILAGDIDMSGKTWTPIGTSTNPFEGIFDGNGYIVSNLTMTNNNTYDQAGLIGYALNATIRNVIVKDVTLYANKQMGAACGRIDVQTGGALTRCGSFGTFNYTYKSNNTDEQAKGGLATAATKYFNKDKGEISYVWSTLPDYLVVDYWPSGVWQIVGSFNIRVIESNGSRTNGVLCHTLNEGISGSTSWTQTFGVDLCPRPTNRGRAVYKEVVNSTTRYYNIYNVYYISNGGSSTACSDTEVKRYSDGGDIAMNSLSLPETTREGYTFLGWYTEREGGVLVSTSSSPITQDLILYAHWEPTSFTVTFEKQGGSGGNDNVTVYYETAMPTANKPSKTGYDFAGYFSEENGEGTKYYNADMSSAHIWDVLANGTLYALWNIHNYTLHYDENGGNALSPDHKEVPYNTAYGVLPSPTRTGYTFAGWFTEATGGTTVSSETIMGAEDVTIHAHWTANQYTVSFNPKGGSPSPNNITVTYDDTYGTLPTVTRAGYTFDGWFTEETSGTEVTSSTTANITDAQTLYAHWTANTYTVNFNSQKGESASPITVTYDGTYTELPDITRYGFEFDGWYTDATSGTKISKTDVVDILAETTLYAHWNPIQVDIETYSVDTQLRGNYFRTFYDSQVAHVLPPGTTAYKGRIESEYLMLTKIEVKDDDDNDIIPKNVPVILRIGPNEAASTTVSGYPTVKKKTISLTTSEYYQAFDNSDNELTGTDEDIASAPSNSYIFSYGSKGLGFYEWGTHALEAHKAYVVKNPENPARALIFRFEDDVTGINDAITDFKADNYNEAIYNLNGIRLSKPQKGINIINGKKIWVK